MNLPCAVTDQFSPISGRSGAPPADALAVRRDYATILFLRSSCLTAFDY